MNDGDEWIKLLNGVDLHVLLGECINSGLDYWNSGRTWSSAWSCVLHFVSSFLQRQWFKDTIFTKVNGIQLLVRCCSAEGNW